MFYLYQLKILLAVSSMCGCILVLNRISCAASFACWSFEAVQPLEYKTLLPLLLFGFNSGF